MSEDARAAAVKAALDGYVDPYLGDSLGAAQAVKAVGAARAGGYLARMALGFPVGGPGGGYAPELEAGLAHTCAPPESIHHSRCRSPQRSALIRCKSS